ncbi:MAG: calcineurin-like phosphoesterase family protein [Gemmatimonadota bacterium]|nr:MAG: calcineurin-like phosphoesterase family protein [Gemmatimonadota bacterium]
MIRTDDLLARGPGGAVSRRTFLRTATLSAAALALPTRVIGDPYAALAPRRPVRPVRIRGQVRGPEGGIGGAAVSDGLEVVGTARDGTFELVSSADRQFLQMSVPGGYSIPLNATGTARFYQPIRPDAGDELEAVFELERLPRPDERHVVLVLADPQTQNEQEVEWLHEETVSDVKHVVAGLGDREVFGIACGDIMYNNLEHFPGYERVVSAMGVPFFQVVGNHDMDFEARTDEDATATFSRHFGPRYYSFDRGAVHYVVLDDVFWHGSDYIGYIDHAQLTWLANDLALIEPGRTVFVAVHIPVLGSRHVRDGAAEPGSSMAIMNREALYRLLEPYEAHVLAGHTHEIEHVYEGGVREHVCGAVCGSWWSGPICPEGTPKGYTVYEVDGSQVSWRYKSTGHGFDHQIRAYPHGANPEAPDEIVANVWDWDPEWSVVWYEDGDRVGEMARRIGLDPLSVELHTGPDLPVRREWVEPVRTGHLFYAPASRDAHEIRIEATDRFGRVYTALVPEAG